MGRVQVINEIHRNKDFFCKKWVEFCQWIEDCGKQLEKYQKEHTDEKYYFQEEEERPLVEKYNAAIEANDKKAVNCLSKALDKKKVEYRQIESKMEKRSQGLKQKGWYTWSYWDMLHLDFPMKGGFPAPPDIVNPILWLFNKYNPRQPNQREQLLLDCALLCVTHDVGVAERKRIYNKGTYKGKYFECEKFCYDLQLKLDNMDKKGELQQAWDDVKPTVKAETEQSTIVATNLPQQVVYNRQNNKVTILALVISCVAVSAVELSVYLVPLNWVKNHPNSYGLQGSIIFLIPCLIVGLLKPQYRKWCWGVGAIAFIVLLLSLMGGPADSNVN